MADKRSAVNIAIIGAGVSGLTAAIYLQNKLGFYDYTIFEKSVEVGGTWRQNTYPGCACDIPVHWYSLSTDPNPNWEWLWADQKEIKDYWKRLSVKHGVEPRIQYQSEMVSAVWDEKNKHYTLVIRDVKTQETRQVIAQVVISAIGVFGRPLWPNIPGIKTFAGDLIHAESWNHDVGLSGKRVAVIGNGCSGAQIVAAISKDSSIDIVNFCRTPSWILPRPQTHVPRWLRWIFRNVPLALKMFRWTLAGTFELVYQNMKKDPLSLFIHRLWTKHGIWYIKHAAPAKYHEQLIPKYPIGCKRIIFDPGYLSALHRPNVELEWDPIEKIVPEGIVTKSGKRIDFDVICFATGFDIEKSLTLNVTGRSNLTLQEYYKQEGGPTGYLGTTIPGFPNWATIFGPNITTGHASVVFSNEMQMTYLTELLKPLIGGQIKSFVPRADVARAWNDWVQTQISKFHVWASCASWYRAGNNQKGKFVALWPGSTTYMWWSLRKPIFENFEFEGGSNWLRKKRAVDIFKFTVFSTIFVFALAAYMKAARA